MTVSGVPPLAPDGTDLRRLDPRIVTAWWLTLGIWLVVILAVALVAAVATASVLVLVLGLASVAVVAGAAAVIIPVRYARFRYEFWPDALELQRGIWWRTRAAVPYHRIQHVDIEQGPIQRRLGLVAMQLKTAAASSVGGLPGLAADDADELRRWLVARSGTSDGA